MYLAATSPSSQDSPALSNAVCFLVLSTLGSQRLNAPPVNRRSTRRNGTSSGGARLAAPCPLFPPDHRTRQRLGLVMTLPPRRLYHPRSVHSPTSTPHRHLPSLIPPRLNLFRSSDPSYTPRPVSLSREVFEAKKLKNSSTSLIRWVSSNRSTVTLPDVGELNIGRRPLRYQNWTRSFGNNVCTYCTRCAKTAQRCRPRILWSKGSCVPVPFAITADSRTLAQETTWDIVWP